MESEYEPLLPIERKLIWYTFSTGVVLLVILVFFSRMFAQAPSSVGRTARDAFKASTSRPLKAAATK
jgi:hypothetical protein